jgi:hypothetical protein
MWYEQESMDRFVWRVACEGVAEGLQWNEIETVLQKSHADVWRAG